MKARRIARLLLPERREADTLRYVLHIPSSFQSRSMLLILSRLVIRAIEESKRQVYISLSAIGNILTLVQSPLLAGVGSLSDLISSLIHWLYSGDRL